MALSSNLSRPVTVGVVLGLLLVGAATVVAASQVLAQQADPETDNTVTRIELREDGTAAWTLRIRTRLDTDQRVAEYRAFQERFRNDTAAYLDPFRTRMGGVVANAANTTGRPMRALNFTASTRIQEVPRRWGVVTYQFTWTNFSVVSGETITIGDVFEGGFFIAANDTLQIAAPDGYAIEDISPPPDNQADGVATWNGRVDFDDRRPRVVMASGTPERTTDGEGSSTPRSDSAGVLAVVLAGIAGTGVLLAGVLYRRRDGWTADQSADDTTGETPDESADKSVSDTPTEASAAPVMTDEERVVALLERHDGRMRQAAIAAELDWSASKTSRTVGQLAEDGTVEKLRLGRENLVELADTETG